MLLIDRQKNLELFCDQLRSVAAPIAFDPKRLKEIASAPPSALSIIRVAGDSMEPNLSDGDEIMVDTSDAQARLRAGIYVIRLDGALAVKRLAPGGDGIAVLSDNPAFPTIPDCAPERLSLIGRVVWAGRRMR